MNKTLSRRHRVVFIVTTLSALLSPARAASGLAVASVEYIAPTTSSLHEVAKIVRAKKEIGYNNIMRFGLQAGDQIIFKSAEAVIAIRMIATGKVIVIKPQKPDFVVGKSDIPGVDKTLFSYLAPLLEAAGRIGSALRNEPDQNAEQYVLAASRGVNGPEPARICPNAGGKSNEPIRFRIPAINGIDNRMAAGERTLFVAWRGGVEPFTVRVQTDKKATVAEMDGIRDHCSVLLPPVTYGPGGYLITVIDGNRTKIITSTILVDTPPPPMPKQISQANFSAPIASLYYATWLTTQDDGAWTWEAVQHVAALGCQSPGAREWLSRYADMTTCPAANPATK